MQSSYWSKVLQHRVGRRRAIAATGTTAAAAAFLVACGGDDDSGSTGSTGTTGSTSGSTGATGATGTTGATGATSSLLYTPVDTTAQAKSGGTFTFFTSREPNHFDGQAQGQVQLNVFNGMVYQSLVMNKMGELKPSTWTEVQPELAASWETSPDNLTITFKLQPNVKWQNRPPVSGRAFDAEDVAASWTRYISSDSPNNKATNANSLNPQAPIVNITAIDPTTVQLKLARPASYIFQRLATMITGEVGSIYPKEAGDTFDAQKDQIGTGPWELDHWTPSVELAYKRNTTYWGAGGNFDNVVYPVLPDYSTQLAQFTTGKLSTIVVTPEDMVPTKQQVPDLNMYQVTLATNSTGSAQRYGWLPINGQPSPFLDIRLRQALAMSVNRDEYIDAFSNVSKFEAAGLPVNTYYYTSQGYVPDWTLDPRDAGTFGDNAKYFKYNMDEAKKLFDAAQSAYPGGKFPQITSHAVSTVFGPTYTNEAAAMDGYASALGLDINSQTIDYNLDYLPKFVTQQGQFEGILYGIGAVTSPDITDYYLWRFYSKTGPTSGQLGFGGTDGSLGDKSGDAQVDTLIEKAAAEFDPTARQSIIADLQRYLSGQQYLNVQAGFADTFSLSWPAISNWGYLRNDSRIAINASLPYDLVDSWYDSSKKQG